MRRPGSLAIAFVVAAACGGLQSAEPVAPTTPMQKFSADLANRIQPDLLACDLGVVNACRDLGSKLENANRLREAIAAYDHGCNLGARARVAEAERCHQYVPGHSCDPAICARCTKEMLNKPECHRADPVICAERERFCRYDTVENCLDVLGAQLCARAAYVYYQQTPSLAGTPGGCPTTEGFARAAAYAELACERATKSPVAKQTGEQETLCKDQNEIRALARKCSYVATTGGDPPIRAVRASFDSYVQNLGGGFAPGAAPTANAPAAYVNPATKTTWTSANLALIASLYPQRVEAPTPPARVESIFGQPMNDETMKPETPAPPPSAPPAAPSKTPPARGK